MSGEQNPSSDKMERAAMGVFFGCAVAMVVGLLAAVIGLGYGWYSKSFVSGLGLAVLAGVFTMAIVTPIVGLCVYLLADKIEKLVP